MVIPRHVTARLQLPSYKWLLGADLISKCRRAVKISREHTQLKNTQRFPSKTPWRAMEGHINLTKKR